MSLLAGWDEGLHRADGREFATYRRGSGPGVIVMHESPGLTPEVVAFADEVVARGFTVVLPHFFGSAHEPPGRFEVVSLLVRICLRREFTLLATGRTTPVAGWLRSLAHTLHEELGGVGVGAVGMCFTGGFALAMMLDPAVTAPIVAQPATPVVARPLPHWRRRAGDVNLDAADLAAVQERVSAGCPVLGVRYRDDPATGSRFETLSAALGSGFLRVELEGAGHATLTAERSPRAVEAVLDFLTDRLLADSEPSGPSSA